MRSLPPCELARHGRCCSDVPRCAPVTAVHVYALVVGIALRTVVQLQLLVRSRLLSVFEKFDAEVSLARRDGARSSRGD